VVLAGYKGDTSSSVVQFTSARTFGGGFNVKEAFTEFDIPLLANTAFAQSLNANLAGRYADYSGSGGIWAYKGGLDWQIVSAFRLRGTYSRDVRAATLAERFDQTRGGLTVQDPFLNNATISSSSFSGGNPNVDPEKADTITVGAVFQPTAFLSGFQASVDWYSISIKDAIGQISSQDIVNQCYDSGGASDLCQYVLRNPVTNEIDRVDSLFINLNKEKISGVDVEAQYRTDLSLFGGAESVNLHFFGAWLDENSVKTPGTPKDDRAGQVGSGQSLPHYKFTMNGTYSNGPFQLFVQERYIGSGKLDRTRVTSDHFIAGVHTIDNNHVPAKWYTDLRLSYSLDQENGGNWSIYTTVTNLFNTAPPPTPGIIGRAGTSQFNQGLYDTIGRRFVAGVKFNY